MGPDEAVAKLAASQHGLFTLAQAEQRQMTATMVRRRLARGVFDRVEPGVYRFAAAGRTWHQGVMAACLAERGWASHRTAAALWELEGCHAGVIEILTPRWRRRPNSSVRLHETTLLEDVDHAIVGCIPVTSLERTLVDQAAVVRPERVASAYHDAINRKLTTPDAVWCCLERLDVPGRPWVAVLRRLVASTLGTDGVRPKLFERRLLDVLTDAGLPAPATQVEICRPDGSLMGRVDATYLDTKLILECDSERWHGSWVRRKRDLRRDREFTALGYRVLRFSWEDLTEHVADVVPDVEGARRAASA